MKAWRSPCLCLCFCFFLPCCSWMLPFLLLLLSCRAAPITERGSASVPGSCRARGEPLGCSLVPVALQLGAQLAFVQL